MPYLFTFLTSQSCMYCLRDRFSPYSSDNIRSSCLAEPQSIAQSGERELESGHGCELMTEGNLDVTLGP